MREQRGRASGGNTSSMQSLLSSSQHDGQPGGAQQTLPPEDGYVAGYMSAFNRSRKPLGGGGGGAAPLPPLPSRAGPPQMPYAPRSAAERCRAGGKGALLVPPPPSVQAVPSAQATRALELTARAAAAVWNGASARNDDG